MKVERREDSFGDVSYLIYPFEDERIFVSVRNWELATINGVMIPAYQTTDPEKVKEFSKAVREAAKIAEELQSE